MAPAGPAGGVAAEATASELMVVGVGASAGGLEAFSELLEALPSNAGFAIVIVQHLAPRHESALPALLSVRSKLPVVQATDGMRVERDHVYVIPPNVQMGIRDEQLELMPRPSDRSQYTPIDFFLRSLADSMEQRAVAVILSGTASDGTAGVREVKAAGGITFAQTPESAKYDGMPRAAIATGLVDVVLPPRDIARELVRIGSHPLVMRARTALPPAPAEELPPAAGEDDFERIFALLRATTGVDFRHYKRPTIQRRLQRRMVLQKLTTLEQYMKLLRETPAEVKELYHDILIHVTRFFREPDSFAAIATHALANMVEGEHVDQPLRIWVPGCSTGEEVYSIAIVVREFLDERARAVPVQIFGTDISEPGIEHARAGFYPASIAADVSPERLRRFFTRVDGGYRVTKAIRDLCIFARQDVTRDPPFSKLDLILCRNVLIYMDTNLQKRLMNVFHYALKASGVLVLGAAETVGVHADLFSIREKKHRLYAKKLVSTPDVPYPSNQPVRGLPIPRAEVVPPRAEPRGVQAEASRVIEEAYAPPGVIVDTNLHVVQFRGQTGAFLEPAPGDPSLSVLKMAREGLLDRLRSALEEARRAHRPVHRTGVRVRAEGGWRTVDLHVFPLSAEERPSFLVLFEDEESDGRTRPRSRPTRERAAVVRIAPGRAGREIARLQEELASSRGHLQSIIQDLEAANEELQSANEEVLSANEELQSTNEELDTAKEELQSTNEELNTVNEELQGRNEELNRLSSDLVNLLGSVDIAIVIVSSDLRVRRFTPMAERVLNLLPGDVGRPIGHLKPNIDCPDLEQLITRAIDTVTPSERDVTDRDGRWYSLRIRPYKNFENRIEGAIVSLFDVHAARQHEEQVRRARDYAEAIVRTVREPLVVLDGELRVRTANEAFCRTFDLPADAVAGRPLLELGDGGWNVESLRPRLESVLRGEPAFDNFEVRHDFPAVGVKTILLNARRIEPDGDRTPLVLVAMEDLTDRRRPAR